MYTNLVVEFIKEMQEKESQIHLALESYFNKVQKPYIANKGLKWMK